MDLLGDCLPIGLDAQVTVKGLAAFFFFFLTAVFAKSSQRMI